jgi:hypothetical protein
VVQLGQFCSITFVYERYSIMVMIKKKTKQPVKKVASYTEKERGLFEYHDGTRTRKADPIQLGHRILASYPKESSIEHDMKLLSSNIEKEALQAFARIVQMARTAFSLEPFSEDEKGNERGVTDSEALFVLMSYGTYCDGLKKNIPGLPTSPSFTVPVSSEKGSTTKLSADSILTGAGQSPAEASA